MSSSDSSHSSDSSQPPSTKETRALGADAQSKPDTPSKEERTVGPSGGQQHRKSEEQIVNEVEPSLPATGVKPQAELNPINPRNTDHLIEEIKQKRAHQIVTRDHPLSDSSHSIESHPHKELFNETNVARPEQLNEIRNVLKDGGMDSMSQVKSMERIESILFDNRQSER